MELHLLRCAQMGSQRLLRIMRVEGKKLRIAIKMRFPTMFSGVRICLQMCLCAWRMPHYYFHVNADLLDQQQF